MTTSHPPLFPLKRLAAIRSSNVDKVVENGEIPIRLCNYVDVYNNDQIHPALEFTVGSVKQNEIDRFGLRSGDVLITKDSETPDDIAVPALVVRSAGDLVCGYHLALLRPNPSRLSGTFLFYAIKSQLARSAFSVLAQGITRFGLTLNGIGSVKVPLPDLPTQKAIAEFLDRETSRIDQLIEKKQRMVEVLGEKRQAVISHAVTKGLDPDVPMKDSGVEWLGENPVHWDITRLKRLAAMQAGTSITSDDIESEGDYPVFGGNGVRGFTSSYTHDGEFPLIGRQGALCGCVNFATGQFWASEHAVVCTPNAKVCSRWLAQLLQAMSLNRYSQSAAQPGLSVEAIGLIAAPKLSYAEQRGIVAFLDRETANIDALVAKVGATRDRLREFRSALITAAVTGQINVSTWGKQGMTDRRLDQIEETKSA